MWGTADATLMGTVIKGTDGKGYGVKMMGTGVIMEGGTVKMDGVKILQVKTGVEVKSGTVMMKGGWISNVAMGVHAKSGTLKMMGNSAIIFTGGDSGYGVKVGGMASATLTDVKIRGMGKGMGVIMEGGTVKMDGVWISGVKTGVEVSGKGMLEMKGGKMTDVQMGIDMSGNGKLVMKGDSKITFAGGEGDGYGVKVGGMAMAHLTGTTIVGSGKGGSKGVIMESGGEMLMDGVKILQVGKGVEVMGKGRLVVIGGEIGFKGEHGVTMSGGQALFYGVSITGSGREGAGTGMYVGSSGKIMMKDVTMSGVGTGVEVTNGGAMWLGDINLRDVQNGMIVTQGSTVRMEGGEITFKGSYGVYL
ncbi:hypothetical protein, partial [Bartonella bovis]|uniref:hypothetical protein n=1 Tax=Bartonella bovis TaxID=155194 RepID=UPI00178C2F03